MTREIRNTGRYGFDRLDVLDGEKSIAKVDGWDDAAILAAGPKLLKAVAWAARNGSTENDRSIAREALAEYERLRSGKVNT